MVPPRTQRDNPDTLNEVQVCGAGNLIRFKTGYFLVVRKQDGASAEENKLGGTDHARIGNGKVRIRRKEPI